MDLVQEKKFGKAAERLGGFMANFDVPTIYRMLGVKEL